MSNWQRLDTNIVYQNPYITVHEDNVITPDGRSIQYGWVETPPAVFVVPIDADGNVVLVKQLRYTTGQPSLELPGGFSDGQDPLAAAKKELEEEAGLHADKWVSLTGEYFVWSGIATQRATIHIAHNLHKAKDKATQSDDYVIETKTYSWSQFKEMVQSGELNDGRTITALMVAGLHLGKLK